MTSYVSPTPRIYLADVIPGALLRDIVLVLSGTIFITVSAFVVIPLPFTPVPIALSTFAVMATGAALGSLRGSLSALLYLLIGVAGAPVFSGGQSGILFPTFGYVIGFVISAIVVGQLARIRADRHVGTALALGALGTLVLYVCGVPWLAVALGMDLGQAILLGVVPFLLGDALKVVVLSGLLPTLWRIVARVHGGSGERD